MAYYRGYFRGFDWTDPENKIGNLYSVHIGRFSATTYTEIAMAGQSPFVVTYSNSNTPFEPIRTSTATISIVHNDYLEDILPSEAKETPVYLYNETDGVMEWAGWLSPKELSQNYTEEYETLQLEASDCLSILKYVKYEQQDTDRKIVGVDTILNQIFVQSELIDYYYWGRTKKVGNVIVLPDHLYVSEQNFYTNDTDKPWNLYEVLEHICLYFGFTAVQWKDRVYLMDYRKYSSADSISMKVYKKSSGSFSPQSSTQTLGGAHTATSGDVRSHSASISFEPIYNRIVVKDNMYSVDSFIPNIFDDQYLTNRIDPDNFYASYVVTTPADKWPSYPWGSKWYNLWTTQHYKKDRIERKNGWRKRDTYWSDDDDYLYYHRPYTHKYWKSYYNGSPSNGTGTQADLANKGGTILDQGVVRNVYVSEYGQTIVPSKLDYTRYICISQQNEGTWGGTSTYPVMKLSGYTNTCPITDDSYLVINGTAIFEKYIDRPYINPDWLTENIKIGGLVASAGWTEGFLNFQLKIGNKYWNGSSWTTTSSVFKVAIEDTNKEYGSANEERHILNNISYTFGINEEGYGIPLAGVDPMGAIEFTICMPAIQFWFNGEKLYNGYCWLKDFDIKVARAGQDEDSSESDIIYANVIPTGDTFVNSFSEITLKLTTMNNKAKPSYSNVIYSYGGSTSPYASVKEDGDSTAKKPEEHIIQKYYDQYSTQTKKITMDLEYQGITPLTKIYGIDVDSPNDGYVQLGTSIDYLYDRQTITCVQIK